ncbi:MAG TPA: hypothetical protein VF808_06580 [Ktedonobacterales bacterium]
MRPPNPHVASDETQRRALRVGGALLVGVVLVLCIGSALANAIIGSALANAICGNQTSGGGDTLSSTDAQATDTPAPVLIAGAQLGGPVSAFDTTYDVEASSNSDTWDTTIDGHPVQVVVGITKTASDSLDGQDRAVSISIYGQGSAGWNAAEDAAIVAAFLPPDGTPIRTGAGFGPLGTDHVYMSMHLANSLDGSVFQTANGQQLTPGAFDWQCTRASTIPPYCFVEASVNS